MHNEVKPKRRLRLRKTVQLVYFYCDAGLMDEL